MPAQVDGPVTGGWSGLYCARPSAHTDARNGFACPHALIPRASQRRFCPVFGRECTAWSVRGPVTGCFRPGLSSRLSQLQIFE
jgi:hypothetical protein